MVDILMSLFLLPFTRQSLAEGITDNDDVGFGKDALYSYTQQLKMQLAKTFIGRWISSIKRHFQVDGS